MPGLHVGGEDGGVVWLNAGVACSWRGGGVGCGMWWCGVQQLHTAWAKVRSHWQARAVKKVGSHVAWLAVFVF